MIPFEPDEHDEFMMLMKLEVDALRRQVELEELRTIRLEARVAGRTDECFYWVASEDEVDDEAALDALRVFRPTAWWNEGLL
jgi:hypothetical protein